MIREENEMSTLIDRFDVTKNYVIEASAGTGKTYNIVKIVEKLLDHGVDLQKMLIVTYTDKAAGELKDRIRKAVGDRNVNVDEASIGTIHSFCQKAIEEFCISSGKSSSLEKIDEDESDDFIRRFLRRKDIYPQVCRLKILSSLSIPSVKFKFSENDLVKKIKEALKYYYLDLSYNEVPEIAVFDRLAGEKEKWDLWKGYVIDEKSFCQVFPDILRCINILRKSGKDTMRKLAGLLDERTEKYYDVFFNGRDYRTSRTMPQDEIDAFLEIKELKDKTGKWQESALKYFIIYHLQDIYHGWQKEKEKNGKQTFNDMLRDVREEVLKGGEFLENLKEKYQYAIIDEFQDTNQK